MRDSQTKNAGKIMADMMRGAMNPGVDQPFEAPRVKERIKRTIATNILHICFHPFLPIYRLHRNSHPCFLESKILTTLPRAIQ